MTIIGNKNIMLPIMVLALFFLVTTPFAATITDPLLVKQCSERWRPRAERCIGLVEVCADVLPVLDAIEVTSDSTVIDDGVQGQLPFTRRHFVAFRELVRGIAAVKGNSAAMSALNGLRIRGIGLCMPPMPDAGRIATPEAALRNIIRPLAPLIRAQRRAIEDDARLTPILLAGLADGDVIDEQQPDGRTCLVGHVRVLFAITQAMTGEGTNTSDVADATDAACVTPLECR